MNLQDGFLSRGGEVLRVEVELVLQLYFDLVGNNLLGHQTDVVEIVIKLAWNSKRQFIGIKHKDVLDAVPMAELAVPLTGGRGSSWMICIK